MWVVGLTSSAGAQSLPRPNVDPGEGPRIDYRDEAWEFWWFLNEETLVERRRRERFGEDAVARVPLPSVALDEVRRALERATDDSAAEVRAAALVALARLGERDVLSRLVAALDDDVHEVRRAAVRAIGILGDASAVELLDEVVRDDQRDGPVRQDAAVALGLIDDESPGGEAARGGADPENEEPPPPPPWRGHPGGVSVLVVSEGAVFSGGADGLVLRHDPESGAATVEFEGAAPVTGVAIDTERLVVAAGASVTVVPRPEGRTSEFPVEPPIRAVALEPRRGERLAVADRAGGARVLRTSSGSTLSTAPDATAPGTAVAWPAGGERVAIGDAAGAVRVLFARSGRVLAEQTLHEGPVTALLWEEETDDLLSLGRDGHLVRWSGRNEDPPRTLAAIDQEALSLARSEDGALVAIGAADGTLRLFLAEPGGAGDEGAGPAFVEASRVAGPGGPVTSVALFGDPPRLVAGTAEGNLAPVAVPEGLVREAAPDGPEAPRAARSVALARLLEPATFFALDDRAQTGVAVGVGVTGDPSLSAATLALLERKLSLNKIVRGHLVASLAALGDRTRREALFRFLEDDDAHARRAAALGVGFLWKDGDERDLVKLLRERQRLDGDVTIRNFLSISMGRVGGRYGAQPLIETLFEEGRGFGAHQGVVLAPRLKVGARSRAAFAALGIGLSRDPAGPEPLVVRFEQERDLSTRGALAVALGLAGDARAAKAIRRALRANEEPVFASYAFLALGLLGDDTYRDRAVHALEHEIDDELLLRAALYLVLTGDHSAERTLLERLAKEHRPGARRASLYALARSAGPGAVPGLLHVLTDPEETAFVRRYAAVALGHVGSARNVTRWHAVQRIFSYPAEPAALLDLLALP